MSSSESDLAGEMKDDVLLIFYNLQDYKNKASVKLSLS